MTRHPRVLCHIIALVSILMLAGCGMGAASGEQGSKARDIDDPLSPHDPLSRDAGFAVLDLRPAIAVTEAMGAWALDFRLDAETARLDGTRATGAGFAACAPVLEVPGAQLCGFADVINMNLALSRASIFVEGLFDQPRGSVVTRSSDEVKYGLRRIGGHDLRHADLRRYWQAMQAACSDDAAYCPGPYETQLFEDYILALPSDAVLITFAPNQASLSVEMIVTHEMMHAQYFLQAEYRETVDQFWQERVPEATRAKVREMLSDIYDASDELLMRNEFQAYILMAGAEDAKLAEFVTEFREPLMAALAAVGVTPVQVEFGSGVRYRPTAAVAIDASDARLQIDFKQTHDHDLLCYRLAEPVNYLAADWSTAADALSADLNFISHANRIMGPYGDFSGVAQISLAEAFETNMPEMTVEFIVADRQVRPSMILFHCDATLRDVIGL